MKQFKPTLCHIALVLSLSTSLLSMPTIAQQVASSSQPADLTVPQHCACFEVKVVGQGPAILLIPGLASSGEVWQSTVEALKANYQLHIFTLAGFAGVKPLPMQSWGEGYLALQQQAILRYIREQQLAKPVVIGHSLGGYLALALAAQTPSAIGGAINVDGLPALGAMMAAANEQTPTAVSPPAPSGFDPMAMAKSMASDTQWQQRILADMFRSDGQTSGRVFAELMRADLRPQLANIRVPVLTLGALQNGAPFSTPAQVQATYETQLALAPAQFHRFAFAPQSKHFIMADAPDWLDQQIQQFLAQQ